MKIGGRYLVLSLGTLGAFGSLGALVAASCTFSACSSSSSSGGGGGGGTGMAPPCTEPDGGALPPGTFPPSNCDNSLQACTENGPNGACNLASCQSKAPGACQPLTDDTGKSTLNFRMRALNIAAPAVLAGSTIQGGVVTPAVSLNDMACGEEGTGTFNWLLQINKTANTVTTGGALTSTDPFNVGYCFYSATVGSSTVGPVTGPITFTGNTFTSMPFSGLLNIPLFAEAGEPPILLPIRNGVFNQVTLTSDNCIGSLNPASLDSTCVADPTTCSKWNTAGSLGGYMTLKDADNVNVSLLGESLCVLLTGSAKNAKNQCPASAFTMGDYCSTTQSAGGCGDSFWLSATFAASAAIISGTCAVDAGAGDSGSGDTGTPADGSSPADAATGG